MITLRERVKILKLLKYMIDVTNNILVYIQLVILICIIYVNGKVKIEYCPQYLIFVDNVDELLQIK